MIVWVCTAIQSKRGAGMEEPQIGEHYDSEREKLGDGVSGFKQFACDSNWIMQSWRMRMSMARRSAERCYL